MPRRSKKRRKILWDRLLGLLLVANVVAGFAFSPATSVTKVRVEGGLGYEEPIRVAMQRLRDIPCARVNAAQVEDQVLAQPAIQGVELGRNIFGRATLEVRLRRPVANVRNSKVVLSSDGRLVPWHQEPQGLPTVALPPEAVGAQVGLCGAWVSGAVARLCSQVLDAKFARSVDTVRVEPSGQVSLLMKDRSRAILGYPDGTGDKFRVLEEYFGSSKRDAGPVEINVVTPSRPVFRKLSVGKK